MKLSGVTGNPSTVQTSVSGSRNNNPSFADILRNASALKYGSSGNEVRALQTILNQNGYHLSVDGIFGPKTRAAVMDYQRRGNLAVDGVVGSRTWNALGVQGTPDYRQAFVQTLLPILRENSTDGIDPKVVLAQAILETGWGRYIPGNSSNNVFGITGEGPSGSVNIRDSSGRIEKFRSYASMSECVADYISIIRNNPRYSQVLAANSPELKARALQKAGYASDPQYADKLCSVINTLDRMGIA